MHEKLPLASSRDDAVTAEYPLDEVELKREAAMLLGLKYTILVGGKEVKKMSEVTQNNANIIVNLPDVEALAAYWTTINDLKKLRSEV